MYEIYVNTNSGMLLTIKDKFNIVVLDKSDLKLIRKLTRGWKL